MKLITTTTLIAAVVGVKATTKKKYLRERNLQPLSGAKAFNPILLGPGAAVPLFKQCLEYGPVGMHPCNPTETIVAAYQDVDERVKNKDVEILTNHWLDSDISYLDFRNGKRLSHDNDYPGGDSDDYLLYCCSQNQALS